MTRAARWHAHGISSAWRRGINAPAARFIAPARARHKRACGAFYSACGAVYRGRGCPTWELKPAGERRVETARTLVPVSIIYINISARASRARARATRSFRVHDIKNEIDVSKIKIRWVRYESDMWHPRFRAHLLVTVARAARFRKKSPFSILTRAHRAACRCTRNSQDAHISTHTD